MQQWNLFIAFFRVGMLGYGGGPASIPLVHKEVVEKYKWLSDDEFGDVLALGNSLPGPIATKMAGYIGYRVSGIIGMLNAVLATILPTIVIMIVLIISLNSLRDQPWVNGMTQAVVPVVGVMLAKLTYDFLKKAQGSLGWVVSLSLGVGSLLLIEWIGLHPGLLIFALLMYALLKPVKDKSNLKSQEQSS
ncbi:chromate transporter [Halobacillus sp. K22]|uniref:chromate transporter n=1 Tax=Halobacillus sp. K22 TaxID=3457431 RepID=UPI003FCEB8C2